MIQNFLLVEINIRYSSGNACCHWVQNGLKLGVSHEGRMWTEGVLSTG